MTRIAGVNLPTNKKIDIGLTYIHGIGHSTAKKVLEMARVKANTKMQDLTEKDFANISNIIDQNFVVEGELRQKVSNNIRRLRDIRCYRGIRHKVGLPVRGQRTRTNAMTRKGGKKMAVGGLKAKITKT